MSLLYDDSQQQIAREAERVLSDSYSGPRLKALLETKGCYDEAFWRTCGEQGWTALALPEDYGGLGLGLVELGLIAEQCGMVACGAPFLGASYAAAQAILRFGDDAAKAAWLPRLASGEVRGAVAFAEGQDALPPSPEVKLSNGRLSGVKPAVSGGGGADLVVVIADGEHGPVLALVDLDQEGVTRVVLDTFDNSRLTADLAFDDVDATTLGGAGVEAARTLLQLQAVVTAHEQVGGAQKMLTAARDYALTRRAFGQVIGAFQSVKHRIAEDYVLVELARANAQHAAVNADHPAFGQYAAAARLSATEAYDTVSRDSTQVHGGIGVTWEADLHLHQRRARTLAIEGGNMIFWEDELVDALGKAT
jgi:acyl-CoA dehydrogenase